MYSIVNVPANSPIRSEIPVIRFDIEPLFLPAYFVYTVGRAFLLS